MIPCVTMQEQMQMVVHAVSLISSLLPGALGPFPGLHIHGGYSVEEGSLRVPDIALLRD